MPDFAPNRRELLVVGALLAGLAACGGESSPPPAATGPGAPPAKLPPDSPDFDRLNTLLQLEFREIALTGEVLAGGRLDPREADIVAAVREHHRIHSDDLSRLITASGGQPTTAKPRYVLPTPLGDGRRALEVLTQSEDELVSAYRSTASAMSVASLTPAVVSNLFAEASHVSALRANLGSQVAVRAFA